jgi:hypothetical protein
MHRTDHTYRAYGLTLRSNRPIPGLTPGSADAKADVHIEFAGIGGTLPASAPVYRTAIETFWRETPQRWVMRHTDPVTHCTLTTTFERDTVTLHWSEGTLERDFIPVLQGHGLAALLHLRDVPLLHACVVATGGRAIVVCGDGGAGKSTTASAFLQGGYALMSDDLAPLEIHSAGVSVHAGYPRLRVFAKTATALGWDGDALPRVFEAEILSDKRYVDLSEESGTFHSGALPVGAIYILRRRDPNASEPRLRTLSPREALAVLIDKAYGRAFLDASRRATLFANMASVAESVPVSEVVAPDDFSALPALIRALAA